MKSASYRVRCPMLFIRQVLGAVQSPPEDQQDRSQTVLEHSNSQRRSFLPRLRSQRQLVEFGAGFAPSRVVFLKYGDEAIAVRGLNEVDHFVNDHVFEKVLRLLHEFAC